MERFDEGKLILATFTTQKADVVDLESSLVIFYISLLIVSPLSVL